jgi:integrase
VAVAGAMTFEQAARKVHETLKPGWKNRKHSDQWINTLRDYAFSKIGKEKVADLVPADFAEVLRPIWLEKPETATRVKQRCHAVIKWCWAQELVKSNPVDVVDHLLPRQPGKRERTQHQPSMPWRDVPAFVKGRLRGNAANVTRALLEFVILTAARSDVGRGRSRGQGMDRPGQPDEGQGRAPRAALGARNRNSRSATDGASRRRARVPRAARGVLSDMVLTAFLRDQKAESSDKGRIATAHEFRSSFRDWASENGYARDLAERALAHTISNEAEAAYHRTDLLEQRRPMMEAWAQHVGGFAVTRGVSRLKRRA